MKHFALALLTALALPGADAFAEPLPVAPAVAKPSPAAQRPAPAQKPELDTERLLLLLGTLQQGR